MKIDKKIIKELSDYLDEFNLTELEYTEKDTKIKVSKNNISINNQTNQTLSKEISSNKNLESQNNISGIEVTSPIIELHISNIYKREEFRHKSLISDVVTGGIFGLGADGYILAIISMQKLLQNEN